MSSRPVAVCGYYTGGHGGLMIFIEADDRWTRDDAWAVARTYAEVCRTRPECRLWKVSARQMDLAGKYGLRRVWAIFADKPADAERC